jgi:hypothetical protein
MSDGRKKKDPPKPTWTERSIPEAVRPTAPTRPLVSEEWGDLVPAADSVVASAYGRSSNAPTRPLLNRDPAAADALHIQRSAKAARVLNFVVEGIHWRAGFAPEVGMTPLNQYVPGPIPPPGPINHVTGFVLRPASIDYDRVLRDIVPPALLKLEDDMFGRGRELIGFFLYFLPHSGGATAGAIAWYGESPTGKPHLVYLQTEVKRADPRILDEIEKTFSASLMAVKHQGPIARPFDFWNELRDATAEVQSTLRNSTFSRSAGEMRLVVGHARGQAEDRLAGGIEHAMAKAYEWGELAFVRVPQFVVAAALKRGSQLMVKAIQAIDRFLAARQRPPEI